MGFPSKIEKYWLSSMNFEHDITNTLSFVLILLSHKTKHHVVLHE